MGNARHCYEFGRSLPGGRGFIYNQRVVLVCEKLPGGVIPFHRDMKKAVMAIQATLFASNYNYQSVHLLSLL